MRRLRKQRVGKQGNIQQCWGRLPTAASASACAAPATDPVLRWESQSFTWQGQLYVFGGFTNQSLDVTTECNAYDPVSNTWSYVTRMPVALSHAAVTVVGDTAYFVGGNIGPMTRYTTTPTTAGVLTYNLATGAWGSIASLPVPTAAGGVAYIGHKLYFFGGISAGIKSDLASTWAYDLNDPAAGWTRMASMPNCCATISDTPPSTAWPSPSAGPTSTTKAPATSRR